MKDLCNWPTGSDLFGVDAYRLTPLGDDGFVETLEQMPGRFLKKREPGPKPKN